jgi:hypothetical protein
MIVGHEDRIRAAAYNQTLSSQDLRGAYPGRRRRRSANRWQIVALQSGLILKVLSRTKPQPKFDVFMTLSGRLRATLARTRL